MSNPPIPARFRQVTQDDLYAYFEKLGIIPRCSLCGREEFSQPLMYRYTPMISSEPDSTPYLVPHNLPSSLGGSREVVFPLTCEHCGTVLLINAEWIAPESDGTTLGENTDE
jgi:hypothetical protein